MSIRVITNTEAYPWELLLLADPDRQMIAGYIDEAEVFIFQENKATIGVMVVQHRDREAEIMNLAVAESHQGRGIGRQLLNHGLAQLAQASPLLPVIIKTGNLPSPALSLYKSLGFVVKETVENYFVDHYPEPIFEGGQQLKDQVILEKRG